MSVIYNLTKQLQLKEARNSQDVLLRSSTSSAVYLPAVDWGNDVPRTLPEGFILAQLQVLVLTDTRILNAEFTKILSHTFHLQKLDASRCQLTTTPPGNVWAQLRRLSILFLHRNALAKWADVERILEAPAVRWLTLFENPIASQPEFRQVVLSHAPSVLAVDYWVVTDDERIAGWKSWKNLAATRIHVQSPPRQRASVSKPTNYIFKFLSGAAKRKTLARSIADVAGRANIVGTRFVATNLDSVIPISIDGPHESSISPEVLLHTMDKQLEVVVQRSRFCSAAHCIQTCWKSYYARCAVEDDHERRLVMIRRIQRQARAFLWKKRMVVYLKDYLNDIDELDLLLSAKEMLALRAMKRIEDWVRRWVKRRMDRQLTRGAATLLARSARGFLVRKAFLRKDLELDQYHQIHFPESFAWEFLVLLNVARHKCRLPPCPRTFKFKGSDLIAVRVPEVNALPPRTSIAGRLIAMKNTFLVRPQRSNRYSKHLWDGPLHRLIDESAPDRINRAFARVKRRSANVDNHCRRAFIWSCAPGTHPMDTQGQVHKRKVCRPDIKDFRDVYTLGARIGEGPFGMVFECTKRRSRTQVAYSVKFVEHDGTWWDSLEALRAMRWRMLSNELNFFRSLQHPNIVSILDVFVDDYFVYVVTERFRCNLDAAAITSRLLVRRPLPVHVIGSAAAQMLSPLAFLHSHRVAHRDIKMENYCVDAEHLRGRFRIVLVDLVNARRADAHVSFIEPVCTRQEYWAPEVVAKTYGHAADVWAVGVALWYLYTGDFPFASLKEVLTRDLCKAERMEEDFYQLSQLLLERHAPDRVAANQALEHRFLRKSVDRYNQEMQATELSGTFQQASCNVAVKVVEASSHGGDTAEMSRATSIEGAQTERKVPASVLRSRRINKIRSGDERFAQGEKVALSLDEALEAMGGGINELEEANSYEWWTHEMCAKFGEELSSAHSDTSDHCNDPPIQRRAHFVQPAEDASVPCRGDCVLLEPVSDQHICDFLRLQQVGGGQMAALAHVHIELLSHRARLLRRANENLVNVADFIVLRASSPKGKFLVQVGHQPKGSTAFVPTKPRFPTMISEALGSGVQGLYRDTWRLVETHMGISRDTFYVHMHGGVAVTDVDVDGAEDLSTFGSCEQLGIGNLRRRHFFDADVQSHLGAVRLSALGLPDEKPFATGTPDGARIQWEWWEADRCKQEGLPLRVVVGMPPEFEGCQPVDRRGLGRDELPRLLREHGVDTDFFGVGGARSLRQLIAEVHVGETQLYENYSGRGLRRYVEVLVIKVKNPVGSCLVTAVHGFDEAGIYNASHRYPKVKLRAFEDKIWAVRRALRELGLPFAAAEARFGEIQMEVLEDARYPGITSVLLEQDVEVNLENIDLHSLDSGDIGATRWFENLQPAATIENEDVNLQLRVLIEAPERSWPEEILTSRALLQFFREARRVGSRPHRPRRAGNGPVVLRASSTGSAMGKTVARKAGAKDLKVYRDATWLNERLLCFDCGSVAVTEVLIGLLLRFPGLKGEAPLVKAIPFLVEKHAREVAAAVCIQTSYRAHKERMQMAASLRFSQTVRRSAICIQQIWRWGLVKRRLHLLEGALDCIRAVKTASLFIEERALLALNLINGVNRYAPTLRERHLGFGYSEETGGIVFVRDDLRDKSSRSRSQALRSSASLAEIEELMKQRGMHRDGGLPTWLREAMDMQAVSPDDPALKKTNGLQGLLLEGLAQQPMEEHVVTVCMPSLQHEARLVAPGIADRGTMHSPALIASGGTFRFVELKFSSVAQAQRRAILLYFCTYSAMHRVAVPLVPKQMLQMVDVCSAALDLWDVYGLVWPQGDRTALYQLRQRYSRLYVEAVPFSGRDPWRSLRNLAWLPQDCEWVNATNRFKSIAEGETPSSNHQRKLDRYRVLAQFATSVENASIMLAEGTSSPTAALPSISRHDSKVASLPPLPQTPRSAVARQLVSSPVSSPDCDFQPGMFKSSTPRGASRPGTASGVERVGQRRLLSASPVMPTHAPSPFPRRASSQIRRHRYASPARV